MKENDLEKEIKKYNREKLKVTLYSILLFIFLTLLTAKCERRSDGNDTFGFPFTFYTIYSEMNTPIDDSYPTFSDKTDESYGYLLLDVLITVLLVQLILFLIEKRSVN